MFRLITFFASTVGLAVFVWLGLTVDLGERTLFGHLRAISTSREAEQLWDGAKSKMTEVVGIEAAKRAEREANRDKSGKPDSHDKPDKPDNKGGAQVRETPGGPPQDGLDESDRQGLRRMLDGKTGSKPDGKKALPPGQAKATAPLKAQATPSSKSQGRVPPPASRPPAKS